MAQKMNMVPPVNLSPTLCLEHYLLVNYISQCKGTGESLSVAKFAGTHGVYLEILFGPLLN